MTECPACGRESCNGCGALPPPEKPIYMQRAEAQEAAFLDAVDKMARDLLMLEIAGHGTSEGLAAFQALTREETASLPQGGDGAAAGRPNSGSTPDPAQTPPNEKEYPVDAVVKASSALAGARSCIAAAEVQLMRGVNSPEDADRVRGQADDAARALGRVSEAMLSLVVTGPMVSDAP